MESKLLPIKDYPDYFKDTGSKAIVNGNYKLLEEYKQKKTLDTTISDLNGEITQLKSEMSEIKNLLLQLLNK